MSAGRPGRVLLVIATVVVVLTLGAGLWTIGAPGAQRDMRLDERRQQQLSRLHDAIESHWQETGALPVSLEALASRPGLQLAIADPVTGEPYGYSVTGEGRFQLCATFVTDTSRTGRQGRRWIDESFPHGIGVTCFNRKAKPRPEDAERAPE